MSEQNKKPRLEERFNMRLTTLLVQMLLFFGLGGGVMLFLGPKYVGESVMKLTGVLLMASLPVVLVLLIRSLFCKVRMDENGVDVDNPFSGNTYLRWDEIRTAAVVVLTIDGKQGNPLIVLAKLEPNEVLTHNALMRGKGLTKHEHVRIPDSPKRREIVEHYLHMELPIIHL